MNRLQGRRIVLGISGGIAAYKTATLVRLLRKEGAEVQVVMTPAAKEFITPVTLSPLSGNPVISDFFTANSGEWHSHVDLGLWADLMVIAPATASTIAKMATGVADNMLITTYLSAKEPVMIAPAMDLDMFAHPTTRRNLEILRRDGVIILDSPSGQLASGLSGKGRMMEPEVILEHIIDFFHKGEKEEERRFDGVKVLITAGPTFEAIDPVRFIGNHSSGKMGFAIAEEFYARGAEVTVVAGPVSGELRLTDGIRRVDVVSAREMLDAVKDEYLSADITVLAAAVADFRPRETAREKIKKGDEEVMVLDLVKNPDIAASVGALKTGTQINIGFALETENGEENARKKLIAKNLDLIVLNNAREPGAGFNTDTNHIRIFGNNLETDIPMTSKRGCAREIANAVFTLYSKKQNDEKYS